MWTPPSLLSSIAYVLLAVAILSLRLGVRVWAPIYASAIAVALGAGVLEPVALLALAALTAACYLENSSQRRAARLCWTIAVILLALALGTHVVPGFDNPRVLDQVRLSSQAAPYSLYLNFDKVSAGLLIIGLCVPQLVTAPPALWESFRRALPIILATLLVLIVASLSLGYLRFEPKWSEVFWLWAPVNLLFTCVSEEAFFRGYVQTRLETALGSRTYVLLATMAGIGYGLVLQRTRRLELSILCHFAMNTIHFVLFTYPFKDTAV
jgi:membrane protease YdiL (CAAX protease family)